VGGSAVYPMIKVQRAALVLFGLLPALCHGGEVKAFGAKDADYSRYKTYFWLPPKLLTKSGVVENDDVVSPMIAKSVKLELTKKGLTEVTEGADLEVATLGLSESIPHLEALIFSPFEGTQWGTGAIATVGRYNREGTLVVNLIDPRTKKSVWAGKATRTIKRGKPEQLGRDIEKAAGDLFKKYPAKR
jgi:hypothetical protein